MADYTMSKKQQDVRTIQERVGVDRCFIIAEGGVNHNGNVALAHALVEVAAESGADAVKFQTFDPTAVVSAACAVAPYQHGRAGSTQHEMLKQLVLPRSAWKELSSHAAERGLIFMSTAFDLRSLDLLLEAGVALLKVPSGELDNLLFIAAVARCGLPVIISTGLGTIDEVTAAVRAATGAPGLSLLHCVTMYPAQIESSNLLAIATMADTFGVPVGWSDHTQGTLTAVAAIAIGASILEKHITTDTKLPGPDHSASADPTAFVDYVVTVRATEAALGDGVKRPASDELINRRFVRRSYHSTRILHPGHVISLGDVELLRPAVGLPPSAIVLGRVVARLISAGKPIVKEDLL